MKNEIDALRRDLGRVWDSLRESHERMSRVVARASVPPASPGPRRVQSMRRTRPVRPRVLVVEDDPLTVRVYRRQLDAITDLFVVHTVSEARHAIESAGWDVVIVDLDLRGENGAAIVPWVRAAHPEARVIVATGLDDAGVLERLDAADVDPESVEVAPKLVELPALVRAARS